MKLVCLMLTFVGFVSLVKLAHLPLSRGEEQSFTILYVDPSGIALQDASGKLSLAGPFEHFGLRPAAAKIMKGGMRLTCSEHRWFDYRALRIDLSLSLRELIGTMIQSGLDCQLPVPAPKPGVRRVFF